MPTTDQNSESKPVSGRPGQEFSCWSAGGTASGFASAALVMPSVRPSQPPTRCRPMQGERQQRRHDHEELQHLVVDRRAQPTQGDVRQHDHRGDDQREVEVPAEQRLEDAAEQEQVDAGDQQLRDRERDRVDQVRAGAEPAAHELRDRPDLRAVVERHHHDAEEEHRRDRADPEVVDGRQPELGAGRRHAHDLDRAEVGGDERQAGHPGRQRAAREEEVDRVGDLAPGQHADAQHDGEVEEDDQVVDEGGVDDRVLARTVGLDIDGDLSCTDPVATARTDHRTPCPLPSCEQTPATSSLMSQ